MDKFTFYAIVASLIFLFFPTDPPWKDFENINSNEVFVSTDFMSNSDKNKILGYLQKRGYKVEKVDEHGIYFVKIVDRL